MLSKVDALGLKFSSEAQAEILIEETVKTAAIEGQTLHRDSVRSSVARRLGLPTAGLPAKDRTADGLVDVLMDAGPDGFEGGLTTRKYVSMAKVSRATAFREISALVEKQVLRQNPGRGRSVSYDLVCRMRQRPGPALDEKARICFLDLKRSIRTGPMIN